MLRFMDQVGRGGSEKDIAIEAMLEHLEREIEHVGRAVEQLIDN